MTDNDSESSANLDAHESSDDDEAAGPSPLSLATAIYRDAAADTSARNVVARAKASLPPSAGRYHAPTVAAHTLEALAACAPGYLRVQVARLEAVGALEAVSKAQFRADEAKKAAKKAAAKKNKKRPKRKSRKSTKKKTAPEAPIADAAE